MFGFGAVASAVTPIINRIADFIPDPVEKAKAQAEATTELLNFVSAGNNAQLAVDAAEANNKSLFVAGWRPFIGWVGGTALAWTYVGQPVASWALLLAGVHTALPTVPTGDLMQLVTAMLGLGAMRTFEKVKGASAAGNL